MRLPGLVQRQTRGTRCPYKCLWRRRSGRNQSVERDQDQEHRGDTFPNTMGVRRNSRVWNTARPRGTRFPVVSKPRLVRSLDPRSGTPPDLGHPCCYEPHFCRVSGRLLRGCRLHPIIASRKQNKDSRRHRGWLTPARFTPQWMERIGKPT